MKSSNLNESPSQSVTQEADNDFYTYATWPDDCPVSNEQNIFSIVCGNTFHSWALHGNLRKDQYHPSLFWQTAPIKSFTGKHKRDNKNHELYQVLPLKARNIIYGLNINHPNSRRNSADLGPQNDSTARDGLDGSEGVDTTYVNNETNDLATEGSSLTNASGRAFRPRRSFSSLRKSSLEETNNANFYKAVRAVKYRATHRVPAISVYIMGNDPDQVLLVAQLFRNIPSRVFRLDENFFSFNSENKLDQIQTEPNVTQITADDDYLHKNWYPTFILQGAQWIHHPRKKMLIIDSGTTHSSPLSYTATDESGSLIGRGIVNSIDMKLRGLLQQTKGCLPIVTKEFLERLIKERQSTTNKSLKRSIESLKDSVAETVLKETALSISNLIVKWNRDLQKDTHNGILENGQNEVVGSLTKNSDTSESKVLNFASPVVVFTGNDSGILHQLLICNRRSYRDFSDGDTIARINNAVDLGKLKVEVENTRFLLHHGIQSLLLKWDKLKAENPNEDVRDALLGQRVAIIPGASDSKIASLVFSGKDLKVNAYIAYGSVVNIIRNGPKLDDDYYTLYWDETSSIDDVSATRLYECLILYTKAKEYARIKNEGLRQKFEDAKQAAMLLLERCSAVQTFHSSEGREVDEVSAGNEKDSTLEVHESEKHPPTKPASATKSFIKKKADAATDSDVKIGKAKSIDLKKSKGKKLRAVAHGADAKTKKRKQQDSESLASNQRNERLLNPSSLKKQRTADSDSAQPSISETKKDVEVIIVKKRGRPRKYPLPECT